MKFNEFKYTLESLASKNEADLIKIQALITIYFKRLDIPYFIPSDKVLVRASKNRPGEIFDNVDRCSYNPNVKDIYLQRCNYREQQVFYCSMSSDTDFASTSVTCLMETRWEYMEDSSLSTCFFTLSGWQLQRNLKLWILPFSELGCLKNRDFKRIKDDVESKIRNKYADPSEIITALQYISNVFCKADHKKMYYNISAAFFNFLLFFQRYKNLSIDGLVYPSANTEGAGMNVALRKDLIDNHVLKCFVATINRLVK